MKHIHITLDLPLMPCLRLLIVWNECACLFVCLCVSVCVLCVGGVNVLVALCTPALSFACLDMSIFSPFLSLKWNTPYHSLTHTRAHTYAYTYKKGDTRCTLDNCDTTHTESQITHSEQRVWVVARATDASKLSIFIPQKKLFHFKVIFNIWVKTRYSHLITKEDMKSWRKELKDPREAKLIVLPLVFMALKCRLNIKHGQRHSCIHPSFSWLHLLNPAFLHLGKWQRVQEVTIFGWGKLCWAASINCYLVIGIY